MLNIKLKLPLSQNITCFHSNSLNDRITCNKMNNTFKCVLNEKLRHLNPWLKWRFLSTFAVFFPDMIPMRTFCSSPWCRHDTVRSFVVDFRRDTRNCWKCSSPLNVPLMSPLRITHWILADGFGRTCLLSSHWSTTGQWIEQDNKANWEVRNYQYHRRNYPRCRSQWKLLHDEVAFNALSHRHEENMFPQYTNSHYAGITEYLNSIWDIEQEPTIRR